MLPNRHTRNSFLSLGRGTRSSSSHYYPLFSNTHTQAGCRLCCAITTALLCFLLMGMLLPWVVMRITDRGHSPSLLSPLAAQHQQQHQTAGSTNRIQHMQHIPTITEWTPPIIDKPPPPPDAVEGLPAKTAAPVAPVSVPTPSPAVVPSAAANVSVWSTRADSVKEGFLHAYHKYESSCFGQDEYRPLSGHCYNWIGAGLTIIDALPTMWVMGLTAEFDRGVSWISKELRFEQQMMTSFFETTIRVLGGLMSAYDLSHQSVLLAKAKELGDKLLPVFNTPSGIPLAQINLATGATAALSWTGGSSLLAELGTCQMEFFSLSKRTGSPVYQQKAQKPIDAIDSTRPNIPGLYPIYISPTHGTFTNSKIAWGAMGDSFYEYLLKMYILTGKQHDQYRRMYRISVQSMFKHLYSYTPTGMAYIADLDNGIKDHKMDHLVCFVPGMLALAVAHGVVDEAKEVEQHLKGARELMKTCYEMYRSQPSGIGAEYSRFSPEIQPGHDASYKLRPETVESLFVMWRVTGDPTYREWGWNIWTSIQQHCRVPGGYAALMDVRNPGNKEDKMESFFLAETLKYLYLLFSSNDLIPIFPTKEQPNFYVFNTECHPIQAWNSWP